MDKTKLNLEIVACRPLVKKAKVCVTRKILKQVKILRTCKNQEHKEKKLRKARRLIAEMHAIKILSPDYVTKFALVTENYAFAGSSTRLKRKRNACAKLIKHKNLMARINSIRNKFVNWREQLPLLLNSVKKEKVEEINESKTENDRDNGASEKCSVERSMKLLQEENAEVSEEDDKYDEDCEEEEEEEEEDADHDDHEDRDEDEVEEEREEEGREKEKYDEDEKCVNHNGFSGSEASQRLLKTFNNESEINKVEVRKSKINKSSSVLKVSKTDCVKNELKSKVENKEKIKMRSEDQVKEVIESFRKKEMKFNDETAIGGDSTTEEKMDDPFFIGKKIIVPKLLQNNNENHPNEGKVRKRELNEDVEQGFRRKGKRFVMDNSAEIMEESKRERIKKGLSAWKKEPLEEEDLHPSWKAKKMQTIKPFEGKKIIFD